MNQTIQELRQIVSEYSQKFNQLSEQEFSAKPLPHKWSKKEVLGHLIDSAQNNLRRFICGQYETKPPRITYETDFWVIANGYQAAEKNDVIVLWKLMNERICAALSSMPLANYSRQCDTGQQGQPQLHTLQELAVDYVRHMKHHVNQIIPGSFDVNH
jgi:hypothetical protein